MKKMMMVFIGWLLAMGLAFAQVNINSASQQELDGLKGIGPAKAKAIVDFRKKNGPFKSVDDLQKVPGIGPVILRELRADVSVTGATRLPAPVAAPAVKASPPATPHFAQTARPAVGKPAKPAGPARPGQAALTEKPLASPAPAVARPAAPAQPAMPARPALAARPAVPAALPKPALPAQLNPPAKPGLTKPAAPVSGLGKPAVPARPAAPARPAQPPAVN